jgi:putative membrane protein
MKPLLIAAALFAATAVQAQDKPFLAKAVQGDIAEVQMGRLAQSHSTSPKYRAYGKMLVDQHGAHRTRVADLARAKGLDVPSEPSAQQAAALRTLASLKGANFEKAFKDHAIMDHEKDIAEYEAATNSPDAQTAALARATLPTLRNHLAKAQEL